jgi:acyl-coenzyme A thioesterase PaaI-like protein
VTEPEHRSLEQLADAVRDLIDRVRTVDAPDDVIATATAQVRAVVADLAPFVWRGPYQQATLRMSEGARPALEGRAPEEFFPYSPIVGPRNPIAPPVRMWIDGDRLQGEVTLRAAYNGPPQMVHGGVIALIFDELLGAVNVVHGVGAFTGTLTVRYERPTPLGQPLEMTGWVERMEGRKVFTEGELRFDGQVTARAQGVFIRTELLRGLAADGDEG